MLWQLLTQYIVVIELSNQKEYKYSKTIFKTFRPTTKIFLSAISYL